MAGPNPLADRAPTDLEDQALVTRARSGDRHALEALVERHQPWIYNIAVRMLDHPQDAEDATQEILVKALTRLTSFAGRSTVRTWLYRIAVNHVVNTRRGRREPHALTFGCYAHGLDATPDFDPPDERTVRPTWSLPFAGSCRVRASNARPIFPDHDARTAPGMRVAPMPIIAVVCVLTFAHYVGAQMRGPILSLYAAAHGATPTGVGLIVGAHMTAAAIGSIPLGRASDLWGRRPLMLSAMALSVVTSLLLPLFEGEFALMTIYGLAGLGIAAFTPSALSLVGDTAPPDKIGHAYAWYSMAHYGAIGIGPLLGGLVAERWGYRTAFVVSAVGIAIALAIGHRMLVRGAAHASPRSRATFADIKGNTNVWAG